MRYGIGWRLWPSYYRNSFWLNDSWQYRLPPAYGPYRWIRYYNDALLVNIYTGEVVDVEYDVFW
jgi:Ni/Co efflux regulator RcnB